MKDSAKPAPPVSVKRTIGRTGKDDARAKAIDAKWKALNEKKEKK